MADQEHGHFRPASHRNSQTSQQQSSLIDLDFQNLSFEAADLWAFEGGFFDTTEQVLPALPAPDPHHLIGNHGLLEGEILTGDQRPPLLNHPHAISEHPTAGLDDEIQDWVLHSESHESVGCKTYPSR